MGRPADRGRARISDNVITSDIIAGWREGVICPLHHHSCISRLHRYPSFPHYYHPSPPLFHLTRPSPVGTLHSLTSSPLACSTISFPHHHYPPHPHLRSPPLRLHITAITRCFSPIHTYHFLIYCLPLLPTHYCSLCMY